MDTAALQLASRFSSAPNSLGYCGLNPAEKAFYNCLVHNQCDTVPEEITHFKGLFPYLKTIAEVTDKDYCDYDVIEAYWLGNDLLKKFKPEHYQVLIKNLRAQGLPDFFIEEITNRSPKAFIPLHIFNVIHIGVGRITGAVPFNIDSINNCIIRWGKISSVGAIYESPLHQINTKLYSLKISKPNHYTLYAQPSTLSYVPEFLPDLKHGDTIAAHWGFAVKILTLQEKNNLKFWTNKVLNSLQNF